MKSAGESAQGWVYVLKLENGKWYVGFTRDIKDRMRRHFDSEIQTAAWVNRHKPVGIQWFAKGTQAAETLVTHDLAHLYGVANVRGAGQLVKIYLDDKLVKIPSKPWVIEKPFDYEAINFTTLDSIDTELPFDSRGLGLAGHRFAQAPCPTPLASGSSVYKWD